MRPLQQSVSFGRPRLREYWRSRPALLHENVRLFTVAAETESRSEQILTSSTAVVRAVSVEDQVTRHDEIATEQVPLCLQCGIPGRQLYAGLSDRLFGAPGQWGHLECPGCALVWLNPWPLPRTWVKPIALITRMAGDGRSRRCGRILSGDYSPPSPAIGVPFAAVLETGGNRIELGSRLEGARGFGYDVPEWGKKREAP